MGNKTLSIVVVTLAAVWFLSGCDNRDSKQALERIAVQDVLSSYSLAVTRHDFDAIAPLFTPDGTWETVGTPAKFSFKGAEVGPGIKNAVETAADLAQINTPAIITVSGDTATARSTIHEFGDRADHSGRMAFTGVYDDKLVKMDGQWKFQSRVFTLKQMWLLPYAPQKAQ
ncbi:MAG: nuclear transport factor 2 family protein [Rhodospirillaceae bacterium]|nr:MAG: nuclear transport factor 2 family protein [Rhodospirillaceae bacterium]